MAESYAFFRGDLVPLAEAKVSIATHALNYGTAVFEGMVGHWSAAAQGWFLFRLPEHYQRMASSLHILNQDMKYSVDELCQATARVVAANGHRGDVYIRAVAYKSSETIGVRLHDLEDDVYIFAIPQRLTFPKEAISCCVSAWRRFDDSVMPPRAKVVGMYVSNAAARSQAVREGYDEAIMLNQQGFVSESCGENIFLVSGGQLITPGVEEGILPGITRDTLMQLARRELGSEVRERRVAKGELYTADECFLSGSLSGVKPVAHIDGRAIGSGAVGPVSARLQALYRQVVSGELAAYRHWLLPVAPAQN